jgi:hypothetical protein
MYVLDQTNTSIQFFYCCTLIFNNIKILFTNKCTLSLKCTVKILILRSIQLSSAVNRIISNGGCGNPTDLPRSRTALKSTNTAYDGMGHNLQ